MSETRPCDTRADGTAGILELGPTANLDDPSVRERAIHALERGGIIHLPLAGFALTARERAQVADASVTLPTRRERESRNGRPTVIFDPDVGHILRARMHGAPRAELEALMARYCNWATSLVGRLFPRYTSRLVVDRLTYRPCERTAAQGLHVDSSYGRPTEGRAMLRVFCNINPDGIPRVWHVGEAFEPFAKRYLAATALRRTSMLEDVMARLGFTYGRRTPYDHLMEDLRGQAKQDAGYQAECPRRVVEFSQGSAWIAITDLVMHAAVSGQHSFDQSFFVPVEAMRSPECSSLAILERLTGVPLA
jgi:hypothetical protein